MSLKRRFSRSIRIGILWTARAVGGFALSRWLTRKALRIICFHGIWMGEVDAHYSNYLFMSGSKFRRRMDLLSGRQYAVIGLDEAIRRRSDGTLPDRAVVITIDDGWYGSFEVMVPELTRRRLPATIYCTTYYSLKRFPVYDVVLEYIVKRSKVHRFDLGRIARDLGGTYCLGDSSEREAVIEKLSEYGSRYKGTDSVSLLKLIAAELNVEIDWLLKKRAFDLMSLEEIRQAAQQGIDVQLHTHRHRFPLDDPEAIRREIEDNRRYLSMSTTKALSHLCYPSGVWSAGIFPILTGLGIVSAVTTEQGLNFPDACNLSLRRISDGENVHELEFESELSGFAELIRLLRSYIWTRVQTLREMLT